MENASKALIMAGGILIALMILGALLLMFNNLSNYQSSEVQTTREAQIIEFNNEYEGYNRNNIRGNDLYTLLNKVVDYNKRKSSAATGTDNYEPMTVTFKINLSDLTAPDNSGNRLFKKSEYTISDTNNTFEEAIISELNSLEGTYGKQGLTSLCTSLTKIFIDDNSDDNKKKEAVNSFNKLSKEQITEFKEIKSGSKIREDVYKYYEYVQFKRSYFDVVENGTKYSNLGRIVQMSFVANGKIN